MWKVDNNAKYLFVLIRQMLREWCNSNNAIWQTVFIMQDMVTDKQMKRKLRENKAMGLKFLIWEWQVQNIYHFYECWVWEL